MKGIPFFLFHQSGHNRLAWFIYSFFRFSFHHQPQCFSRANRVWPITSHVEAMLATFKSHVPFVWTLLRLWLDQSIRYILFLIFSSLYCPTRRNSFFKRPFWGPLLGRNWPASFTMVDSPLTFFFVSYYRLFNLRLHFRWCSSLFGTHVCTPCQWWLVDRWKHSLAWTVYFPRWLNKFFFLFADLFLLF